ncbi:MAG: tRNA 2-selenouridine(34) synthase MnmH [Planctomycetes bacterium]|nr:tRNA 2-selenouridine(34) synthase MnmH [Planctomycetota bacterium]
MRLPTFSCATVLASKAQIVDLRSPAEYARDHLPGAMSVPLFDDQQRAIVGTLYKRESPEAAYKAGLEMAENGMGERLAAILGRPVPPEEWRERFTELAARLRKQMREPGVLLEEQSDLRALGDQPLILHCWRGGMRSQSVALLLRALGEDRVGLLPGGYKSYRNWVMQRIERLRGDDFQLFVLRGATGVGKTEVLRALEARRPGCTLDLEGLAGHRSSVLGAVGLEPASQPAFESGLLQRIEALRAGPIFVEGESRKVGDVVLPRGLYVAMQTAPQLKLTAPIVARVERLGEDYLGKGCLYGLADDRRLQACARALDGLRAKLGDARVDGMQAELREGAWRGVTERLLHAHYDPLYSHGECGRSYLAEFDATSPDLLDSLLELRARYEARLPEGG